MGTLNVFPGCEDVLAAGVTFIPGSAMVGTYMCVADPWDLKPDLQPPPVPTVPWPWEPLTPDRAKEVIERAMLALDEFAIMSALDKLDDAAKRRVLAWFKARVDVAPPKVG